MASKTKIDRQGPFRAYQLGGDDRFELSHGHPIYCQPTRHQHAGPNLIGAATLETDPNVDWAAIDAGFSPEQGTLRAPDIAIAPPGEERGRFRFNPMFLFWAK